MQRQKKQLLGLGGLALASIMTVTACALPARKVSAAEEKTIIASEVPVRVVVESNTESPNVKIESPESGASVVDRKVSVTLKYTKVTKFNFYLTNLTDDPESKVAITPTKVCTPTYSGTEQTCEVEIDLGDGKPGLQGTQFSIEVEAFNENSGNKASKDSVSIYYRAAYIEATSDHVVNGDPIVDAFLSNDVKMVKIQAYKADESGNLLKDAEGNLIPVLTDEAGNIADYVMKESTHFGGKDTTPYQFALPLYESDAPDGKYVVYMWAYADEAGEDMIAQANTNKVVVSYTENESYNPGPNPPHDPNLPADGPNNPNNPYRPGGPKDPNGPNNPDDPNDPNQPGKPGDGDDQPGTSTPNTGSNLFSDLNISSADYVTTGLVSFGLIAGFALFLVIRRSRR